MNQADQQPKYHPVVEANFHTSGINMGRTKNTELVQDHAVNELGLHQNDAVDSPVWQQKLSEDMRYRLASAALAGVDLNSAIADEVSRFDSEDTVNDVVEAAYASASIAVRDHERLQANTVEQKK